MSKLRLKIWLLIQVFFSGLGLRVDENIFGFLYGIAGPSVLVVYFDFVHGRELQILNGDIRLLKMESFLIDEDRGLGGDDLLVDHDGELKIISGFRVVRVLDVDG